MLRQCSRPEFGSAARCGLPDRDPNAKEPVMEWIVYGVIGVFVGEILMVGMLLFVDALRLRDNEETAELPSKTDP